MEPTQLDRIIGRPISHIGYVVEDIPAAAEQWRRVGIGPFFLIDHPVFEVVESRGEPGVFDHSGAFAWWGDFGLELHQFADVQPADAAHKLGVGAKHAVNHVAIETPTPEQDSARLEELGMPLFLFAKLGPVEDRFHYAPFLGHAIEIHRQSEFLDDFWKMVSAASRDWDGSDALRSLEI